VGFQSRSGAGVGQRGAERRRRGCVGNEGMKEEEKRRETYKTFLFGMEQISCHLSPFPVPVVVRLGPVISPV